MLFYLLFTFFCTSLFCFGDLGMFGFGPKGLRHRESLYRRKFVLLFLCTSFASSLFFLCMTPWNQIKTKEFKGKDLLAFLPCSSSMFSFLFPFIIQIFSTYKMTYTCLGEVLKWIHLKTLCSSYSRRVYK